MSHFCNRNTQTSITLFFNWQSPVSFSWTCFLGLFFLFIFRYCMSAKFHQKRHRSKEPNILMGFFLLLFQFADSISFFKNKSFYIVIFFSQLGNDRASPSSYGAIFEIGSLNRLTGITCLAVGSWPASHTLDRCIRRHLQSEWLQSYPTKMVISGHL